ncbi:MAG TPA: hypothetical protein DHU55_00480 [Blastocatellia bacterium]|jgi:hypothetical protein|nr:hypothetical protein [Blastocatellia bacterium]HCX28244.1 hypothetical protein [Blastocatellia bacterium]
MKKSLLFFLAFTLISAFSQVFAQTPAMPGPPKVALIVREDIKPGMMGTHNRHSAEFANIFGKLQTPNHRIALVPVAGSENEVIYLTGAATFAELEGMQKATDEKMSGAGGSMKADLDRLDKEAPLLHAGMRDMLAVLRPEYGYGAAVNLPTMRYFAVTTVRLRPGQEDQYAELLKMQNAARDKAKAELHVAAFQVIAGTPNTTLMFFRPMKSLAEYDLRIGPRVREAMSEDQRKKADKLAGESIVFTETSVYAMNPQMSYVSKEMAAGDPGFWNRKPEMIAKPKPKMRPRKPTAPPPPPAN